MSTDKDKEKDPSFEGTKTPSIFQMAKNFSGELAKYIKEGAPNVSNKDYVERLEACNACPHLIKKSMRCGLCGCMLEHKAKWKTTTCPHKPSKWKEQYIDPKTAMQMEAAKHEETKKAEEEGRDLNKEIKNEEVQMAREQRRVEAQERWKNMTKDEKKKFANQQAKKFARWAEKNKLKSKDIIQIFDQQGLPIYKITKGEQIPMTRQELDEIKKKIDNNKETE